tara:strand:- start:109 stop:468 length:360 start_codon:yes stop_codon:yes gene_type:complete
MVQQKPDRTSLDIMNIDTIDMTFSRPTVKKQSSSSQRPVSRTSPSMPSSKGKALATTSLDEDNPWWHMGTTQYHNDLTKEDPSDFSWALRTDKIQGGLDFGLNLSGSTMPFTGRKKVFY